MSHLASLVAAGSDPDMQNSVTSTGPVKQNSSRYGPDLAETLVESRIFWDPVHGPAEERKPMRKLRHAVGGDYSDAGDGPSAPLIDLLEAHLGCMWIRTDSPLLAELPHGGFERSGSGKGLCAYGFEDDAGIKHVMSDIEE
jgi:hypothetical protein